jgi:hypothetical protein
MWMPPPSPVSNYYSSSDNRTWHNGVSYTMHYIAKRNP